MDLADTVAAEETSFILEINEQSIGNAPFH